MVRGQRVMLDADLAALFGVSTRALNQAIKRNLDRFPADFLFRLSPEEKAEVVTDCDHLSGLRFSRDLLYTFTEHGALSPKLARKLAGTLAAKYAGLLLSACVSECRREGRPMRACLYPSSGRDLFANSYALKFTTLLTRKIGNKLAAKLPALFVSKFASKYLLKMRGKLRGRHRRGWEGNRG